MEDNAPGWDAIDRALAGLYPGVEPLHVAPAIPGSLGGDNPLDGISAYWRDDPAPHWHFVTYGLTELYTKESDDPDYSGFGYELTYRLGAPTRTDQPPVWAFRFLQSLARAVFTTDVNFEPGLRSGAGSPIAPDGLTEMRDFAFAIDPELGEIDSPHGRVTFLQVIGLLPDEAGAIGRHSALPFLGAARPFLPLWITDLQRPTLLTEPTVSATTRQA